MESLVSIIMPSYNTDKYIGETLDSVLKQTYKKWELIIVDDCSNDDTVSIINSYNDPRIHLYINKKNSGAAISRNYALKEAKGEWIAFLDSDDIWKENKLDHQIEFMRRNNYYFSCTKREEINELSEPVGRYISGPKHVGKKLLSCYCWLGSSSVMYHAPTVGVIQIADLKKNNDYAIWLKAIQKADCYYLDECLESYRVRKDSISHDKLWKLIHSHYLLWRVGEKKNVLVSCFWTGINIFCGLLKKIFYVKGE